MESKILRFIETFRTEETIDLFTNCACFWFAHILFSFCFHRLGLTNSVIVYNPHTQHFAVRVSAFCVYDIRGRVEDHEDYIDWVEFHEHFPDEASLVETTCIDFDIVY